MKKNKMFMYIVPVFIFCIIVTFFILYIMPTVDNSYQVDCGASYRRKSEHVDAKMSIRLTLFKMNMGSVFFSGKAYIADGKEFTIERWYYFNYKNIGKNRIVMDKFRMQKRDVDDVPDAIFNKIAWSIDAISINFEVSRFKNSYIISNPFSPLMVCIKN